MPNISTEKNTNDIYKYKAEMMIDFGGGMEPIILDNIYIKGIVVEYDYEVNNFPLIYLTVNLHKPLQDLLSAHQENGTVIFKLQKYIMNGDNPDLLINCFEGKFVYVLPKSIIDDTEEDTAAEPVARQADDIGNTFTIGLVMVWHANASKKAVNNIIKKGTLSSAIYYILNNQKFVMESVNNRNIPLTILRAKGSVSKALSALNHVYAFYNTPYRFFMDFNYSYLLSSSGKITKAKDELYSDVIINIKNTYDEANMEGMMTDPKIKAYIINVSESFTQLAKQDVAGKQYNKFTSVTTSGSKSLVSAGTASGELTNKRSYIRLPNNNSGYLSNLQKNYELRKMGLAISTTKIDSSIFTINKRYTINADETYGPDYTGEYLLAARHDVYAPEGEGMNLNITLTFYKVPD